VTPAQVPDVGSLSELVGKEMVSPWLEVTQQAISQFADLTGDRQWIHLDADRARADSPYGGTIAHGFLTLALITQMLTRTVGTAAGARLGVNSGLNKVRFPAPVPAGARVRGRMTLARVEPVEGGVQATWSVLVEREGGVKPCCAAEWLVRYYV
jgi:acyl dehydratase